MTNLIHTPSGAALTYTALVLPAGMLYQDYERCVAETVVYEQASQWWLGDLLLQGEERFGDLALQAFPDYAPQTYSNCKWVCKKFPPERRRPAPLTLSHHAEVATLDSAEQDELLDMAALERWSVSKLRQIRRERQELREPAPVASIPPPHIADQVGMTYAVMAVTADGQEFTPAERPDLFVIPDTPQTIERQQDAKSHVNALLDAMSAWGRDEDGIHPDAWEAYLAACAFVGRPVTVQTDEE